MLESGAIVRTTTGNIFWLKSILHLTKNEMSNDVLVSLFSMVISALRSQFRGLTWQTFCSFGAHPTIDNASVKRVFDSERAATPTATIQKIGYRNTCRLDQQGKYTFSVTPQTSVRGIEAVGLIIEKQE